MRLLPFLDKVASLPGQPSDYYVYLAAPAPSDSGTDEVGLVPIVKVEWDDSSKTARLYPELPDGDDDTLPTLDALIGAFPHEWEITPESLLQVQIPILRTEADTRPLKIVDLHDMVVGPTDKEIWLLANPRDDFKQAEWPA